LFLDRLSLLLLRTDFPFNLLEAKHHGLVLLLHVVELLLQLLVDINLIVIILADLVQVLIDSVVLVAHLV